MRPDPYKVLPFLDPKLHPQRAEDDARAQAARRASFTRARLNDREQLLARGSQLEEVGRGNEEAAGRHRADHLRTPINDRRPGHILAAAEIGGRERQARNMRAIGLAKQGRYEEAAEVAADEALRTRYTKTAEAIGRDDSERCECPPQKASAGGVEYDVPRDSNLGDVYSRRHGRVVALMACPCGFWNARPLDGVHAQARAARAESRAAGKAVMTDARLLATQGGR